jgi:hypothetical protein
MAFITGNGVLILVGGKTFEFPEIKSMSIQKGPVSQGSIDITKGNGILSQMIIKKGD